MRSMKSSLCRPRGSLSTTRRLAYSCLTEISAYRATCARPALPELLAMRHLAGGTGRGTGPNAGCSPSRETTHADLIQANRPSHASGPVHSANLHRKFTPDCKIGGAGYGDRTRLAGLGSQSITTMLSPRSSSDRRAFGPADGSGAAHSRHHDAVMRRRGDRPSLTGSLRPRYERSWSCCPARAIRGSSLRTSISGTRRSILRYVGRLSRDFCVVRIGTNAYRGFASRGSRVRTNRTANRESRRAIVPCRHHGGSHPAVAVRRTSSARRFRSRWLSSSPNVRGRRVPHPEAFKRPRSTPRLTASPRRRWPDAWIRRPAAGSRASANALIRSVNPTSRSSSASTASSGSRAVDNNAA